LVDEMARRYAEREALVGGDRRLTYAQLREEVRRFAKGLLSLGVKRGDRVAILMGNTPEWVIADLAICTIGGTMVAVNTWLTPRELAYVLDHSEATILIATGTYLRYDYFAMLAELEPLSRTLPALQRVVHVGDTAYRDSLSFAQVAGCGSDVSDVDLDAAAREVEPTDVAYLLYTSGSTSSPKGVPLQHRGLIANMFDIGERMRVTERDRLWLAVSLFWGLGCENALFNLLTHGGCIVLQASFDAGEALRLIQDERCTLFYGTPNMAQALAEHPDRPAFDLSTLRSGGTIGSRDQVMRLVDLGAHEICNIYGLTETYGNCCVTDADDPLEARLSTVGRPLPGFELRIVEATTGRCVGPGEVGEIRVKGYVATGYFRDEDRTREAFDTDGFFRTGDLGYVDDAGRLVFRGRSKEMIKTGGINVAPVEVEETLMHHPAVLSAYVVGIPDAKDDERVGAVIVRRPGFEPDADALIDHCRRTLASYKVPKALRFARESDLPLTTTGKLHKSRLVELFGS
jgi:fatty-acyl-CoA synthase